MTCRSVWPARRSGSARPRAQRIELPFSASMEFYASPLARSSVSADGRSTTSQGARSGQRCVPGVARAALRDQVGRSQALGAAAQLLPLPVQHLGATRMRFTSLKRLKQSGYLPFEILFDMLSYPAQMVQNAQHNLPFEHQKIKND